MIFNFIILVFFSFTVSATNEKIEANIHYGDKITNFTLKNGKEPTIQMQNSRGEKSLNKLSENNFKVLRHRFRDLKTAKTQKFCRRSRMQIQYTDPMGRVQTKESCFGIKAGFAKDYQRYANLLVDVM